MTALVDFLLARIAEDETPARSAMGDGSGEWESWNHRAHAEGLRDLASDGLRIAELPDSVDEHVARHSPARVLAECAAKRKLIELAFDYASFEDYEYACCHSAEKIRAGECPKTDMDDAPLLRALAEPYADHVDYREEWRP